MKSINKNLWPLLFAANFSCSLQAQELHIYYNLFNDEIKYEKEGAEVDIPKIKQGDEVVLHLTEFNNYLYTVELEITQEHFTDQGAATDASLMNSLLPGMGLPGTEMGDGATGGPTHVFDIPLLTINDSPITLMSLFGGSRGSEQMLEQLESTTAEVSNILTEMDGVATQLKGFRNTVMVSRMAMDYVEVLKSHPQLRPSYVREMCRDYYQAVFRKNPDGGMRLGDVLDMQDDGLKYESLLTDFKNLHGRLGTKVKRLDALAKQYRSLEMDDDGYRRYANDLSGFLEKSKAFNLQLEGALKDSPATVGYPSTAELTQLQLQLAEVISNDFTYHSRFQVTGDHLTINVKVVKLSDQVNGDSEIVKSRWLYYEAKGGLKMTGSVGLNFSQFFDPSQSFSVNNGIIVGEDDGAFSPTVTSFLHFYSYSGKKVSLGGSFGIGFPLTGNGDNQSLQFFAGPSLIFGSTQRFILNFGLTGGRVTRLARGFKVGDEFDVNLGDIPTRNPYELGLFIGASFNIGGG